MSYQVRDPYLSPSWPRSTFSPSSTDKHKDRATDKDLLLDMVATVVIVEDFLSRHLLVLLPAQTLSTFYSYPPLLTTGSGAAIR